MLVRRAGLEPARPLRPRDFKSLVSTNSTIRACVAYRHVVSTINLRFTQPPIRAYTNLMEAPTGNAPVYTVLQTVA